MKDSGQLSREWDAANPQRAHELNDMLDACATLNEKRALYKTFTKEEQNGLITELLRRKNNKEAQPGSLVRGKRHDKINGHTFHFSQRSANSVMSGVHLGTALVLGMPEYGSHVRYVLLQPPWVNKEGHRVMFAEAGITDLEVVE